MPDSAHRRLPGPIAIVSHSHPSVSKGGAEIAAYSLYEGLLRIGVDTIFIAICPAADRHKLMLGSEREYAVICDPLRYDHFYQLGAGDVWRQLKAILLQQDVRLVNFHHFLALGANTLRALATETDIPFVVTLHEFLAVCAHHGQMVTRPARRLCQAASPAACTMCFPEHSRQQFAARKQMLLAALAPAAAFIAPSQFLAERMVAWGLNGAKFAVIENGLRDVGLRVPHDRQGIEGRPWVFGYFGQITPFKGGDTLLDTIDLLSGRPGVEHAFRIRVHGTLVGQENAFLQRFTAAFANSAFASFSGPYENADVQKLMAACDYVLVPSTWWENSPVVIQEAFAAGRPVICTGIGGMAEKVVNRRHGLHFRQGDGADLARAMVEAADDVLYRALCSGLPEPRDQTSMARDYLAIFNRMTPKLQIAAGSTLPAAQDQPAQGRLARRKVRIKSAI
jgi:glycosyltransferase involved in cell wall biosynthesis